MIEMYHCNVGRVSPRSFCVGCRIGSQHPFHPFSKVAMCTEHTGKAKSIFLRHLRTPVPNEI